MSPAPTIAVSPSVDVPSTPKVVIEPPKPVAAAAVDQGLVPGRLVDLYKLSEAEARLLSALLAAKTTTSVAELAQELSLPLGSVLSLLGPEGLLRGCALVELPDVAELGWAVPQDGLRAGRGLHLLCGSLGQPAAASDELMPLSATLPGLAVLSAPAPGSAWVQELLPNATGERPNPAIADLVREQLVATQPVLLCLGGGSAEQLSTLAQQARLRLQRPVVTLDATALAGWPLPLLVPALRRLRRDSDVRGTVLLVREASALGAAGLRSLLRPRPPGQTAPLILCSDGAPLNVGTLPPPLRGEPAWTVVSLALRGASPTAPPASPPASISSGGKTADAPEESEDPAVSASRQEARRQAAIDAARAMGRPVPKELMTPPAATPAPGGGAATTPGAAGPRPAVSTPSSGAPPGKVAATPAAPAPAPAAAAPPPAERPPTSDAGPRRTPNPRLAAALAAAGLPPPGSEKYRSGEHPGRRSDAPAEAAAPSPAPAAAPPTPPAAVPAVATPATASDVAPPDPPASPAEGEDAAPLPLEAEAPLEEQLRVVRSTPNQAQRAEILRRLTGARHSAVIQLFRSFVSSPHPAVREAAEGGMSAIFGPSWNRSRQIAPPTQPPRSDDGGRGPGGAF